MFLQLKLILILKKKIKKLGFGETSLCNTGHFHIIRKVITIWTHSFHAVFVMFIHYITSCSHVLKIVSQFFTNVNKSVFTLRPHCVYCFHTVHNTLKPRWLHTDCISSLFTCITHYFTLCKTCWIKHLFIVHVWTICIHIDCSGSSSSSFWYSLYTQHLFLENRNSHTFSASFFNSSLSFTHS